MKFTMKKHVKTSVFVLFCATTNMSSMTSWCCCGTENEDVDSGLILEEVNPYSPPIISVIHIEPTPEVYIQTPPTPRNKTTPSPAYDTLSMNQDIAIQAVLPESISTPQTFEICEVKQGDHGFTIEHESVPNIERFLEAVAKLHQQNHDLEKAVIFDIDFTALDSSTADSEIIFSYGKAKISYPLHKHIQPIFILYKKIIELGIKVFFVTSRSQQTVMADDNVYDYLEITIKNLHVAGYTQYTNLYAMPLSEYQQCLIVKHPTLLAAQWKETKRKEIRDCYNVDIVATFDDDIEVLNTQWHFTGKRFLVCKKEKQKPPTSYQNNQFSSPGGPALTSAMQHDGLSWCLDTQYP